jgi:hypothetical protein
MAKIRQITARGLTASNRGSVVAIPKLGVQGLLQSVEWFDKTTVLTLSITVDVENMTIVEVKDA